MTGVASRKRKPCNHNFKTTIIEESIGWEYKGDTAWEYFEKFKITYCTKCRYESSRVSLGKKGKGSRPT
jgi:hypothetical protein